MQVIALLWGFTEEFFFFFFISVQFATIVCNVCNKDDLSLPSSSSSHTNFFFFKFFIKVAHFSNTGFLEMGYLLSGHSYQQFTIGMT